MTKMTKKEFKEYIVREYPNKNHRVALVRKILAMLINVHINIAIEEDDALMSNALKMAQKDINSFMMGHKISQKNAEVIPMIKEVMGWINDEKYLYVPFTIKSILLLSTLGSFSPFRQKTLRHISLAQMRINSMISKHIEETKDGSIKSDEQMSKNLAERFYDEHLDMFCVK
jgi:hypothetical protein